MSGFVAKLASVFTGGIAGEIADIADKFIETPDEKREFREKLQEFAQKKDSELQQTIRQELESKEKIIIAEMAQGDNYTKRARPTLIYAGMLIIFFNYCLIPAIQSIFGTSPSPFAIPDEFWLVWGGAVSVYSIGRSAEKRGMKNSLTNLSTGSKPVSLFD